MDQEPDISFLGLFKHHSPKDSFFENLISISTLSLDNEALPQISPNDYLSMVNADFENFLRGCYWNFKSNKDNRLDTYNYFKYIIKRLQICKGEIFYERGGVITYSLSPNPISIESEGMHRSVYCVYERINEAISILEDYIEQLNAENSPKEMVSHTSQVTTTKIHGFKVKHLECLMDAYNQLIKFEIIAKDVDFTDFEKTFLGGIPNIKVKWLKGPGLLSFFIKAINGIGIKDEKKDIWKSTTSCFQEFNGADFDIKQLRHGKVPKDTKEIQMVIDTFNEDSYKEE
jgi:hypothetical protein